MNWLQFRVLYRQFLFRVVDLELLSLQAQGDASKLLGQFAALLILIGILFAGTLLTLDNTRLPRDAFFVSAWPVEYFLIATTMLVAGVLSIL